MPMKKEQRLQLIEYAKELNIGYTLSTPQTFTSSIDSSDKHLVLKVDSKEKLEGFLRKMYEMNQDATKKVSSTVIGGGRGGNNNSYSIGKIWEGTDVFIQLTWEPAIAIDDKKKTEEAGTKICRISPNMMLIELNKELYKKGYHSTLLTGCLPFMSFAGGLSTGSHTAYGYLADIVEGVELLLPNGEPLYVKKGDPYFDLVCNNPSMGLLGVITGIDIKVNTDKMKLQRSIEFETYDNISKINPSIDTNTEESTAIIFSSVSLEQTAPVKVTRWKWVSDETPNSERKPERQAADRSVQGRYFVPWFARKHPKTLGKLFKRTTLDPSLAGTITAEPEKLMGAESRLLGTLTELGLFFEYDPVKMPDIMDHLLKMIEENRASGKFPINTAIFMRFPKMIGTDKRCVAMDFASLGQDLESTKAFVNELVSYLKSRDINVKAHYGKSSGIAVNQGGDQKGYQWDSLKKKYEDFYSYYGLDKDSLHQKIQSLEDAERQLTLQNDNIDENLCQFYKRHCDRYLRNMDSYIDKILKKYPEMKWSPKIEDINKYDRLINDRPEFTKNNIALNTALKNYQFVASLKKELSKNIPNREKIAKFHHEINQNKKFFQDRNSKKWLAVFMAGVAGLGILSYWTAKKAHSTLFKMKNLEQTFNADIASFRHSYHLKVKK